MNRVLFSAGEASGDAHGAAVLTEMRRMRPDLRPLALGGPRLAAAGAEVVFPLADHAVTGFVEVFRSLTHFRRALAEVARLAEARAFDLFVPIDFPDFNFRAARIVRRAGIPVFYYIAPQVWAWRPRRAKTLAALADRIGTIFPFEAEFLRASGGRAEYVGHPLLEAPPPSPERVPPPAEARVLALLPGSRANERARHLPLFRAAAKALPEYHPVLSAPTKFAGLTTYGGPARDLIAAAEVALAKTGTISLEAALLGTPVVACYRMAGATYWIARALVRTKYTAMANLLLDRPLVPEFIQRDATPENLARAAREAAARREEFRAAAEELRKILDGPRASRRAAEIALATMDGSSGGGGAQAR